MLIAVGGLIGVQRVFSTERRRQNNDVAGFIYAVLGAAYTVLLGLMLIAVWEQWGAAHVPSVIRALDDEETKRSFGRAFVALRGFTPR